MTQIIKWNFILRTFVIFSFGLGLSSSQDAATILTGLLNTFATSSKSPGCPGECRHALSALFCSHVSEDADCGDPQLRCCTEPEVPDDPPNLNPPMVMLSDAPSSSSSNNATKTKDGDHSVTTVGSPKPKQPTGDHTFHRPPMLGQVTPISVGTNLTVRPGSDPPRHQSGGRPGFRPGGIRRKTTTRPSVVAVNPLMPTPSALTNPRQKPLSQTARPCLGMCVTKSVANLCAQISEFSQCSHGEACCLTETELIDFDISSPVTPFVFTSTISPPTNKSSVLKSGTTTITLVSRNVSTSPSSPTLSTTTTRLPSAITHAISSKPTTVSVIRRTRPTRLPPSKKPSSTTLITTSTRVPPRHPEGDDGGAEECPGSCVMGLISLLCDDIVPHITCSNGGKCCISRGPSSASSSDVSGTTAVSSTSKPPIGNCPGICLPSLLTGVCNRPSVLVPETLDCEAGTVCCDNSLRETGQTTTTTAQPTLMDLFSWPLKLAAASGSLDNGSNNNNNNDKPGGFNSSPLGSALSELFGGGGSNSAPSNGRPPLFGEGQLTGPPRPNQPNIDDRIQPLGSEAVCPGTCIAAFLKMTCFGSSQIAEMFFCPKDNLVCCAPKAALVGLNPENQWNYTSNQLQPTDVSVIGYTQRPPSSRYICGIKGSARPETPRVVGGRDASPGEWCWQAALINYLNQYLCGGALIGRQWVLTAAHCVTNVIRSGDAIYVRVGDYDLTSKYGSPGAQTFRVATTYIHHNHNSQTLDNNIALLKLEKLVELKEGVCLVCLPARGVAVESGQRCVVTGYGYMGESGPIPLRIRAAVLPVVSEQECVRKINTVTENIFILPASSFCAGGEEGQDACQGDGGGPLSCEVDGYYEISGIVSWGFGCGRADIPGIYVKVSSFIGWINQIISVNNS